MENKKPIVKLFTFTKDPLHAITLGIEAWHSRNLPEDTDLSCTWTEDYMVEKVRWLLKQPHTTPLEYFNMVWVLKNVSRAFQQQLTRYRMGIGFSIQSLRVVDVGNFATDRNYTLPDSVKDKTTYHDCMLSIEDWYNRMIAETGESTEDARGILPLNVHSPITMAVNYRALLHIVGQRLCHCAQSEWRSVVSAIRSELSEKVHPVFAEPMDCQCKRLTKGKSMCKTDGKLVTSLD